jgi:universal stress protein E
MSQFKNILVGIDLLQSDQIGSAEFSPPVAEAIKQATWLAEKCSARLTFFAAVELPEDELYSLTDQASLGQDLHAAGHKVLEELVRQAAARGIDAACHVTAGEGWVEITRQVIRADHDLVVVGTRNLGAVQRFLFGSTAMKLLHNCPCPVWVTRPEPRPTPTRILVASDFKAVSDEALRLGLALASHCGASVDLLHAVDYPLDRLWSTGLLDSTTKAYHDQVRADARGRLQEQLARVAEAAGPTPAAGARAEIHVVEGLSIADTAILDFVETHHVDLVVMGTMARSGIPGVFIGNTAERLVTHLKASLLAVKPADFRSAIEVGGKAPRSAPYR